MSNYLVFIFVFLHPISLVTSHEIELDRLETLLGDDDKIVRFHDFRIKKFNRSTAVMSGTYEYLQPFGDNLYGITRFLGWSGGQYKQIWESKVDPLCSGLQDSIYNNFAKGFIANSNKDVDVDVCPFPAGNYTFHNYKGDASFLPPNIPSGDEKWRIDEEMYMRDTDELLGGFRLYCNLRNNQSDFMYG